MVKNLDISEEDVTLNWINIINWNQSEIENNLQ